MTGRKYLFSEHISRFFITLTLLAGALWLTPLPQPAQAAAQAAPVARPASAAPAAPAQDPPPLPEPFPTLLVTTATNTEDPNDGQCDLSEAMQAVIDANLGNNNGIFHECQAQVGHPNVIGFSQAVQGATISQPPTVNGGELPFAWGDLTILGPITIKPDPAVTDSHLLRLAGGATLTLINVTLNGGHTSGDGAAILDDNFATLNLYGCIFSTNIADDNGGAISSNGTVNVVQTSFTNNQATGISTTGLGGAIALYGVGQLTISLSKFTNNSAKGGGGAIYALTPNALVEDAIFSGNQTGQDGTILRGGGALFNDSNGVMTILRTQFDGNQALQGQGGAVFNNAEATLTISGTEFSTNQAGDATHGRVGGAVFNSGLITVSSSSFSKNTSISGEGGGLGVDLGGTGLVANSTFVFNTAPFGFGGGLVVSQTQVGGPASSLTLENDTVANNGLPGFSDAGIYVTTGQNLTLGNTLLVNNLNSNCFGADGNYTNDLGNNLESGHTCHLPNSNGNKLDDVQSNLGPPAFNGGALPALLTMPPLLPSHAIDAGAGAICADALVDKQDERGSPRPINGTAPGNQNPACDIGAVESDAPNPSFGSIPSAPGPIDVGHVQIAVATSTLLEVSNSGNYKLHVDTIALTGANAGDFGVSPNTPYDINPGDPPTNMTITCTPSAASLRTATLSFNTNDSPDHATVQYQLTCTGAAAPTASVNPSPNPASPVSFADTEYLATSSQTLQFANNGNLALNVLIGALTGANAADFAVVGSNFSVNPGSSHNIQVHCTPSDYGLRSATLSLTTSDSTHATLTYHLTCLGIPAPSPFLLTQGTSVNNGADIGLRHVFGLGISPDGKYVYSTGNNIADTQGRVATFSRDPLSGALQFINYVHDPFGLLDSGRLIALSPGGQNAYVAAQADGNAAQMTLQPDGEMWLTHGNSAAALAGAFGVAVSADGRSVYATGGSLGDVVAFTRTLATGNLSSSGNQVVTAADLSGAAGVVVSPDGQNVYVTGNFANSLDVFKRNPVNGTLSQVQTRKQGDTLDGTPLYGMGGANRVAITADGASVYVATYGDSAVVAFNRSAGDGKLTWVATYQCGCGGNNGLHGAYGVDVSPDGLHVLAVGSTANAVVVFDRNPIDGTLTYHEQVTKTGSGLPLGDPQDVRISPDGASAYVSAYTDNAIVVLPIGQPQPLLTHFSPASAVQNGPAFILHVYGANFLPTSKVYVGAHNPPFTYISPYQLDVSISSGLIGTAGLLAIQISTPEPVGGDAFSFIQNLVVSSAAVTQNPIPSIDHLAPAGQPSAGGAVTLDVYGTNFINGAVIKWNGAAPAVTTFINSGHLQITVPQALVSQPGVSSVTVLNGAPGGGTSNAQAFTVAQPGQNAVATLNGLSLASVFSQGAGSKDIQLTLTGQHFILGAMGQINGVNRPTQFVDSTHLKVTLFGGDLAVPASTAITVYTPAPGGGVSNPLSFIIRPLHRLFLPLARK